MSYALALIGFLGFFITNIYMIIQAVKKKFRKKLLLPPLICFILFIIGASLMPSSTKVAIKTIQISLENQETEYDINQTIPVSISVEPSDADISDLTYISSAGKSDTFTFTDNKIETGTAEGSYEIYVKCGDIESNKLSITVVDVAARKAAGTGRIRNSKTGGTGSSGRSPKAGGTGSPTKSSGRSPKTGGIGSSAASSGRSCSCSDTTKYYHLFFRHF